MLAAGARGARGRRRRADHACRRGIAGALGVRGRSRAHRAGAADRAAARHHAPGHGVHHGRRGRGGDVPGDPRHALRVHVATGRRWRAEGRRPQRRSWTAAADSDGHRAVAGDRHRPGPGHRGTRAVGRRQQHARRSRRASSSPTSATWRPTTGWRRPASRCCGSPARSWVPGGVVRVACRVLSTGARCRVEFVRYRRLGNSGTVVSNLTLGTMTFGGATPEEGAFAQLDAFLDAGGTLVDTADVYTGGESERIVGRWFADRASEVTDRVVLATKGRFPTATDPNGVGLSRRHLSRALDASLGRLGVEVDRPVPGARLGSADADRGNPGLPRRCGARRQDPALRTVQLHRLAVAENR